ncbi:MAG: deoxyribonuclease IV [Simkaniaceae bacterium]
MAKTKAENLLIGAHTSIAGGVHNALTRGEKIGATTIQIFTANQRQWASKTISAEHVALWQENLAHSGIKKIMSHDSYLINLGSPDAGNLNKSLDAFHQEILRCRQLDIAFLNFHPGAAKEDAPEACIARIINSLLSFEKLLQQGSTRLLLETTAGQGTAIGAKFEEIAEIVQGVENKIPIGVCIDTCHIFAAGYDIRDKKAWEDTLLKFDQIIGIEHLHAMHVNDSVHDLGSRRDRHAHLGEGKIGIEGFKAMMQHPKLRSLPKYLETPNEERWAEEIALLRKFAG